MTRASIFSDFVKPSTPFLKSSALETTKSNLSLLKKCFHSLIFSVAKASFFSTLPLYSIMWRTFICALKYSEAVRSSCNISLSESLNTVVNPIFFIVWNSALPGILSTGRFIDCIAFRVFVPQNLLPNPEAPLVPITTILMPSFLATLVRMCGSPPASNIKLIFKSLSWCFSAISLNFWPSFLNCSNSPSSIVVYTLATSSGCPLWKLESTSASKACTTIISACILLARCRV